MDCSPPGSSVHGILQARILEWGAISCSRGSCQPRDRTCVSCGSCTAGRFFTMSHCHHYIRYSTYIIVHAHWVSGFFPAVAHYPTIYRKHCLLGSCTHPLRLSLSTLLDLKWITNRELLHSTGSSAQCCVAAWMGGEFGGEWIHAYVYG